MKDSDLARMSEEGLKDGDGEKLLAFAKGLVASRDLVEAELEEERSRAAFVRSDLRKRAKALLSILDQLMATTPGDDVAAAVRQRARVQMVARCAAVVHSDKELDDYSKGRIIALLRSTSTEDDDE